MDHAIDICQEICHNGRMGAASCTQADKRTARLPVDSAHQGYLVPLFLRIFLVDANRVRPERPDLSGSRTWRRASRKLAVM